MNLSRFVIIVGILLLSTASKSQCFADFNYNITGQSVQFLDTSFTSSGNPSYYWEFGDGDTSNQVNPFHTYINPGSYWVTLTLTTSTSCFDTSMALVHIGCNVDFTYTPNGGNSITFNSTTSPNLSSTYLWNFGDGNGSTQRNPTHIYNSSGAYTVSLTLTTGSNQVCSIYDTVYVNYCQSYFTYSSNSNGDVTFYNNSTSSSRSSYFWNFGDGNSLGVPSKSSETHTYLNSGTYQVSLNLYDSLTGCSSIYYDSVQVNVSCKANYSYAQKIDTISFQNLSSNYQSLSYNFGDGNSSNQASPTHIYGQSGTYIVCQTVYDSSQNCQDTFCDTITVNIPQCQAQFSYTISNDTLRIQNQASNYSSLIYTFGDGSSSSQENPTYIYTQSGTYSICQTVFDSVRNCQNTFCDSILINVPQCQAGFSYQTVGDSILFQNTAQNYTSIKYYFGDGDSSTIENPYHYYTQSNTYIVRQVVEDSNRNCIDTYLDTISVNISTSCIATFKAAIDTSKRGTLYLINNSSDLSTHDYNWDFGDGDTTTGRTPTHSFSAFGAYQICLTVIDQTLGCQSSYCDTIGLDSNGNVTNKSTGFTLRVLDGSTIGIEEQKVLEHTSIYPNPASERINIQLHQDLTGEIDFQLLNFSGKEVKSGKVDQSNSINIENLSKGVYFLRLNYQGEFMVKKFIKQ